VEAAWHTFITGVVEAGLAVGLEVAGNVGSAQHLATDVAGHLALVSDHVGAQAVFGGESRGAGLGWYTGTMIGISDKIQPDTDCITTGSDWESRKAAHNWPSINRVWRSL
jgi:hypothetical protein